MPTLSQLVKNGRDTLLEKKKSPALQGNPQRRGVCVRVYTTKLSFEKGCQSKIN